MKKWTNKKWKALCLAAALIGALALSIGGVLAWIQTDAEPLVNTFTPGKVSCEVTETFDGIVKKDVSIKNTGNADAYIRVAVVANWVDKSGNIVGAAPAEGMDYQLALADDWENNWFLGNDGYYYCKDAVAPQENTPVLIEKSSVLTSNDYRLDLQIIASAIQSSPVKVVQDSWGVTTAGDRLSGK